MWQRFTQPARNAIIGAQQRAAQTGTTQISDAHILLGAMDVQPPDKSPLRALVALSGLKWDEVRLYAESATETGAQPTSDEPKLTPQAKRILELAVDEARRQKSEQITTAHIFIACFRPQSEPGVAQVLAPLGVKAEQLRVHLNGLGKPQVQAVYPAEHPASLLNAHGHRALSAAGKAMRETHCGRVSTLHLLLGVLENPENQASKGFAALHLDVEAMKSRARAAVKSDGQIAGPKLAFTPAAKRALDRAKAGAIARNSKEIGTQDLLLGLLPTRALLIERAQFGSAPDDPAEALLGHVNADRLRAVLFPNAPSATAPTGAALVSATDRADLMSNPIVQNRLRRHAWIWGVLFFFAQIFLALSIEQFSWKNDGPTGLMLGFLIGSVGMTIVTSLFKIKRLQIIYPFVLLGVVAGGALGLALRFWF